MSDTAAQATQESRWDANAAFWIQIIREHRDRYRNELTDPAMLQTIGPANGLRVLDAGCAEGYLARMLTRQGAAVTGIDSSAKLIQAAREQAAADGLAVSFDLGSVDALPYEDEWFDLVICNHVINDLEDPTGPIREFSRVLKGGGRLIIMMLHPCFYNRHAERDQADNGLLASSYFGIRAIEQTFKVDGLTSPVANRAWFRPLEYYTEQLRESGFVITELAEPHPSQNQLQNDAWWRKSFTRPLFMLIAGELPSA